MAVALPNISQAISFEEIGRVETSRYKPLAIENSSHITAFANQSQENAADVYLHLQCH